MTPRRGDGAPGLIECPQRGPISAAVGSGVTLPSGRSPDIERKDLVLQRARTPTRLEAQALSLKARGEAGIIAVRAAEDARTMKHGECRR